MYKKYFMRLFLILSALSFIIVLSFINIQARASRRADKKKCRTCASEPEVEKEEDNNYEQEYLHDPNSSNTPQKATAKITLEDIEEGKLPAPEYIQQLTITRTHSEKSIQSKHIQSLLYLYPNVSKLVFDNLGITEQQAHEIASHFHHLAENGLVIK